MKLGIITSNELRHKFFRRLIIAEGSTISIQALEENEPFNLTEYASSLASLVTSFATIYLLTK